MVGEEIEATELTYIKEATIEKDCELVGVYLPTCNIIVVSLYRSPTGNAESFICIIEGVLARIYESNNTNARIIIAGDTNINLCADNRNKKNAHKAYDFIWSEACHN